MKTKTTIININLWLAICLFLIACDKMEDNYKQYLGEYNYSGKIDSLRVYSGFERVVLAWDNPKDQKSKKIRVIYGPDSLVKDYDQLVDSISIDNLNEGTGYEFIVYTLDAYGNLSVPTSITAFPVSKSIVEALTPPTAVVQAIGPDQYISLVGLSNVLMEFSGHIEYTIKGPGNFTKTDKIYLPDQLGEAQINIPVSSIIPLPFLPEGEYEFNYKVSVRPIMGNLVSIDDVWLSNSQVATVQPVVINPMTIPGEVSERNNNSPGSESIEKVIDGNANTKYLTRRSTTWMMWKMQRPFIATKYVLTSANDAPDRDPKDWVLEGSKDGQTWTELDKKTDFIFEERFQKKTFLLTNQTAYSYYRMTVTANRGGSLFQLADWILYYDSAQ